MNLRLLPLTAPLIATEEALLSLLDATLLATEKALRATHGQAFSLPHPGRYFSPEDAEIRALVEHAHRLRAHLRRRQATLAAQSAERIEEETDEALF